MINGLQVWFPMLSRLNCFHSDVDELFERLLSARIGDGRGRVLT